MIKLSDQPRDLRKNPSDKIDPSARGSASLEEDLHRAERRISKHNLERVIFGTVLLIIWDAHTFKSYEGWAPVISLLVLELIVIFLLAYRLDMHEITALFWGAMKSYAQQDPGDTPNEDGEPKSRR